MSDITVVVQPQTIATVEVGVQGPTGPAGSGFTTFATVEAMFATAGTAGEIAYCTDHQDQHWKWSIAQNTWIPAF